MSLRLVLMIAVFSMGVTLALVRLSKWRFSLRSLLIAITVVAVLLGIISISTSWGSWGTG